MVLPFDELQLRLVLGECPDVCRETHGPVLQLDAVPHLLKTFLRHGLRQCGDVRLLHMVLRRKDVVGERPVIGQEHETGRVRVEASRREEPVPVQFRRHEVEDRLPGPVFGRADVSFRLVQHEVQVFFEGQRSPGDRDRRPFRVYGEARVEDDRIAYPDKAVFDDLSRFLAAEVGLGPQQFVEAHALPSLLQEKRSIDVQCSLVVPNDVSVCSSAERQ